MEIDNWYMFVLQTIQALDVTGATTHMHEPNKAEVLTKAIQALDDYAKVLVVPESQLEAEKRARLKKLMDQQNMYKRGNWKPGISGPIISQEVKID